MTHTIRDLDLSFHRTEKIRIEDVKVVDDNCGHDKDHYRLVIETENSEIEISLFGSEETGITTEVEN